jgi:isopropylmalate/homocitrate/citramalate synthase
MIKILDSTLREGEQTPGVCFDSHIKIAIAELLDRLGVDIIEAGHPLVTPEIKCSVKEIAQHGFRTIVGAHARSLQKDVDLALECSVGFLGIFYCVSDQRLNHHAKNLVQAVDRISNVIAYAREQQPELVIRYTPEDTVRSKWENVITAAAAAVEAGADVISIADTTGFMIPGTSRSMYDFVKRLKEDLDARNLHPQIAVHCHNDRGLALANALDAYRAGVDIIDVTVLGLGERAGLVDLATLLSVLIKDFDVANTWDLQALPQLYQLVSRYSGIAIPAHFPITGANAFTHCAGVHTQAALKDPLHYQSIDPQMVGRQSKISLDHMSGISAIHHCLDQIGVDNADDALVQKVLQKVKDVGQMGRVVDLTELQYIVSYINRKEEPIEIERGNEYEQQSENRVFALHHQER